MRAFCIAAVLVASCTMTDIASAQSPIPASPTIDAIIRETDALRRAVRRNDKAIKELAFTRGELADARADVARARSTQARDAATIRDLQEQVTELAERVNAIEEGWRPRREPEAAPQAAPAPRPQTRRAVPKSPGPVYPTIRPRAAPKPVDPAPAESDDE